MESSESESAPASTKPPVNGPLFIVDKRHRVVAVFDQDIDGERLIEDPRRLELADALSARGIDMAVIGELLTWIEEGVDAFLELSSGPFAGVALGCLYGYAEGAYVSLIDRRFQSDFHMRVKLKYYCESIWVKINDPAVEKCLVLVVDDSLASRNMVVKALRRCGCRPDWAASSGEALAMCSKREYDLVLTDLRMPGIDGFDLARILRRGPKLSARRMMITGLDSTEDEGVKYLCIQAGMEGSLSMPPSMDSLKQVLQSAMVKRTLGERSVQRDKRVAATRDWRAAEVLDVEAWSEEAALHRRIVRRFIADGEKTFAKMAKAAAAREAHSLELTLRAFKGSSDAIRALRLSGLCLEILDHLSHKRDEQVNASLVQLGKEMESLKVEATKLGFFEELD